MSQSDIIFETCTLATSGEMATSCLPVSRARAAENPPLARVPSAADGKQPVKIDRKSVK
jgi:hypothetical protein